MFTVSDELGIFLYT